MKRLKLLKLTWIASLFLHTSVTNAQSTKDKDSDLKLQWGLKAISVSVSNTQYGIPFVRFFPLHPGVQIGLTFVETQNSKHSLSGNIGYFYHDLLAHAPYAKVEYNYHQSIKNVVGLDAFIGTGYAHAFNPNTAYAFNPSTKTYESTVANAPFFIANLGIGLSVLTFEDFTPFVQYDAMMIGSLSITTVNFRIGTKLNF